MWLFATIEVCSRLWAGSVLGRRSYRNTAAVINDVVLRGRLVGVPLIATNGLWHTARPISGCDRPGQWHNRATYTENPCEEGL